MNLSNYCQKTQKHWSKSLAESTLSVSRALKCANITLDPSATNKFEMIYDWRDQHSRIVDESPEFVFPSPALVEILFTGKTTEKEVLGVCNRWLAEKFPKNLRNQTVES